MRSRSWVVAIALAQTPISRADAGEGEDPCAPNGEPLGHFFRGYGPEFVVCVDAQHGLHVSEIPSEPQYLHPLPHQRIRVRVFHDQGTAVAVSSNGHVKASIPGVSGTVNRQQSLAPELTGTSGESIAEAKATAQAADAVAAVGEKGDGQTKPLANEITKSGTYDVKRLADLSARVRESKDSAVSALAPPLDQAIAALNKARASVEHTDFILGPFGEGPVDLTVTRSSPTPVRIIETLLEARSRIRRHEDMVPDTHAQAANTARDHALAATQTLRVKLEGLKTTSNSALADFEGALAALDIDRQLEEIVYVKPDAELANDRQEIATAANRVLTAWEKLADDIDGLGARLAHADGATSTTVALVVDNTYTGAVSIGVGAFFLGASSGRYAVEVLDGGESAYVDAVGTSPADLDLVLGYNQLIHRRPATANAPRAGVTFGVNIASLSTTSVNPLSGIYCGPSWGVRNLTVALVTSLRPVDRLKDRYRAGGAVAPTTKDADLVRNPLGLGLGLVIYAPEIIKNGQNGA